ncbi:MAG TPA: helix-turn-helix domain-containing protein [Actinospica sp.]|jgi:excisionase family DNA binding protein|nr:helix-turn-helix domain-containing protein [Actinospica sp.]
MSTYLTPAEVMSTLKIGKTSFYKLLKDDDLTSFKVGRSRRVPESSLLDYVARQCIVAE